MNTNGSRSGDYLAGDVRQQKQRVRTLGALRPRIRATTLCLFGSGPPTKMSESGIPTSRNRFAIAFAAVVMLPVEIPVLISICSL